MRTISKLARELVQGDRLILRSGDCDQSGPCEVTNVTHAVLAGKVLVRTEVNDRMDFDPTETVIVEDS